MNQLPSITFIFPNNTTQAQEFFAYFSKILQELPNATKGQDRLVIVSRQPLNALPVIIFKQASVPFPGLHFGDDTELALTLGNLLVNHDDTSWLNVAEKDVNPEGLTVKQVYEKLHGHIVRLDHTGLNIPTALWSERFAARLAERTNLYAYPTGDPWLFVIPATPEEFTKDIRSFVIGREPRFELVNEAYSKVPMLQFDIETDLTRTEIEKLFPEPYGVSFPGLADYFRAVHLRHIWPGLVLRLDIRFKNTNPAGDWETGKWLVEDGKRITNESKNIGRITR